MAEQRKYMVEFLAKWIQDKDYRQRVLFDEAVLDGDWPNQRELLKSFKRNHLIDLLVNELEQDLGINLRRLRWEVWRERDELKDAGILYENRYAHVRGIEPEEITREEPSIVTVRGHGWDENVQIGFRPLGAGPDDPAVFGEVLSVRSDIDIYQRAVVRVTLNDRGPWTVHADVTGKEKNPKEDETPVVLNVR